MKLSIITINYNNREGLLRTIESVEGQSCRDFEWIVVDGGSTDGSRELIEDHASNFAYWVSERDEGIYNAMNKGIRHAQGEYLLFLNSGDWLYETTTIEQVLDKGLDKDICFGRIVFHSANGSESPVGLTSSNFSIFGLLTDPLPHPASFIRRNLFEQYGLYDESYRIAADQEFFWRVLFRYHCSTRYLGLFISHQSDGGISQTECDLVAEEDRRLRSLHCPRLFGDDHPELYNPKDVRKAMALYNRLRGNPIARLIYRLTKMHQ